MSSLVLVEHNESHVLPVTYNAIGAAAKLGSGDITCLVAGSKLDAVVTELSKVKEVKKILVASDPMFTGFLPGKTFFDTIFH